MTRALPIFIILFQIFCFITPIFAAKKASGVGVAFSGGGAKGLYHVGVLEALEEYGVPIDFVAGTSMGANVAGMYAAGYSPAQMRELALSGNLEKWSSGQIDNTYGAYFRTGSTLRENAPMLAYRIDPQTLIKGDRSRDKKVGVQRDKMAQALISSTQIDLALTELFAPASQHIDGDFNNLMVPFLCVASDVTNNRAVVIQSGDLGRSIRASMAIPVAFTPIIDEEGNMLYDGGVQNNFPWKPLVERHNPRIIIGSTCSVDNWANSKSPSIFDQILKLSMKPNDFNLPKNGVLISRDVQGGSLDFSNAVETMQMGYDDTVAQMESILANFKPSELKSKDYYDRRRAEFQTKLKPLTFNKYAFTKLSDNQEEYLMGYMNTSRQERRRGADELRTLSFEELKKTILRSTVDGGFITEFPHIEYDDKEQQYSFEMGMEHKPSLKLAIGGNLSSTLFNQLYFSTNYTHIGRTANSLFAELYLGPIYNTGRIGGRIDTYKNAPLFFDLHYNFSAKNLNRGDFNKLTTVDNTEQIKRIENYISIGAGTPINRRSLLTARLNVGKENLYYTPTTTDPFDKTSFSYATAKLEAERNTIDDIYFPTTGSRTSISAIGVVGREESHETAGTTDATHKANRLWSGAKMTHSHYLYIGRRRIFNIGINIDGVYTSIPDTYTPTGLTAMLPSYQPTTHSKMIYMPSYSAPRYLGVGICPTIRLWRELHLMTGVYSMLRDKIDDDSADNYIGGRGATVLLSSEIALAYKTPIGAVRLTATKYGFDTTNNLYLTFNFGYTIFAPRGTFY